MNGGNYGSYPTGPRVKCRCIVETCDHQRSKCRRTPRNGERQICERCADHFIAEIGALVVSEVAA